MLKTSLINYCHVQSFLVMAPLVCRIEENSVMSIFSGPTTVVSTFFCCTFPAFCFFC